MSVIGFIEQEVKQEIIVRVMPCNDLAHNNKHDLITWKFINFCLSSIKQRVWNNEEIL